MNNDLKHRLEDIWTLLEAEMASSTQQINRVYRRLELEKETGLRLGITRPDNGRELIVQISSTDVDSMGTPKWMGMGFEIIIIDIPHPRTHHMRLYLKDSKYESIFITVCTDIADSLLKIEDPDSRATELLACLERWNQFFKKYGPDGLSRERQQGLYGELVWLELTLECNVDALPTVKSWKGCSRGYHDFEIEERVVEVKTTTTKEPRRVFVNNERQLDDKGFEYLFLFVVTLHRLEQGEENLPVIVKRIRSRLEDHPAAMGIFESSLRQAGYLDIHLSSYKTGYVVKKLETFVVKSGFPRIIDPPSGVGDLAYSITLSSCNKYKKEHEEVLNLFLGNEEHD